MRVIVVRWEDGRSVFAGFINPPIFRMSKPMFWPNRYDLSTDFPPSNKLHKLFNRHTVRTSYSCIGNMKCFINKHNKRILTRNAKQNNTTNDTCTCTCNCGRHDECPAAGKCSTKPVVYQADVTTKNNGERKSYIGITTNKFKQIYRNHLKSFRNAKYSNDTELSQHVWNLQRKRTNTLALSGL